MFIRASVRAGDRGSLCPARDTSCPSSLIRLSVTGNISFLRALGAGKVKFEIWVAGLRGKDRLRAHIGYKSPAVSVAKITHPTDIHAIPHSTGSNSLVIS